MTATNISAKSIQPPPSLGVSPTAKICCSACGVSADAACDCGAPYLPAGERAKQAIEANPQKSDRAIAAELGIGNKTVSRARQQSTVSRDTVRQSKRIGKDGKERRVPVREAITKASKKLSAAAIEVHRAHDAYRDQRDAEAAQVIARLRETLADSEDVMALCDYIEWHVNGSPVEPTCGTDFRIWRITYRPVVQKPDQTPYTKMRNDH